jgi:hypothetical protein
MAALLAKQRLLARMKIDQSPKAWDSTERETNAFAAELLIPPALLAGALDGRTLDLENEGMVAGLAKRFRVSTMAKSIGSRIRTVTVELIARLKTYPRPIRKLKVNASPPLCALSELGPDQLTKTPRAAVFIFNAKPVYPIYNQQNSV